MTQHQSTLFAAYARAQRMRAYMTTALAATFVIAQVAPTYATIDNAANAVGTYNGVTGNYGSSSQSVPVANNPSLTVLKTVTTPPTTTVSTNGTITYNYKITNTGNVTMNGVAPADAGPTFNGSAGTGTLSAFTPATATIAPGAFQNFTATYTISQLDNFHAAGVNLGVSNTAGATGTFGPSNTPYTAPAANKSTATTTVPAFPAMTIAKTYAISHIAANSGLGTNAGLGDTVTYTYVTCNTGNVTMTNVQVNDLHVGTAVALGAGGITGESLTTNGPLGAAASTDATANNGIWSSLAAGACVTSTWAHIVTQAEIDHG